MGTVTDLASRREPRLAVVRPAVYTPAEAAKILGVGTKTLWAWDLSGKLPAAFITPGGHRRWAKADVDALARGTS